MDFQLKEKYGMDDLLSIMTALRAPNGCPWDQEQTHQSIRNCFLEETCEAIEAIDTDDPVLLREELGDVLLQVLFHAELEKEAGRFDFSDVVDGIAKKMIVRHPHVFGDVHVENSQEVLVNWDAIKKRTKNQETQTEVLRSVSPALPALMRTVKVQTKAKKAGFGLPTDLASAQLCLETARAKLFPADNSLSYDEKVAMVGKWLFCAASVARMLGVDPEEALSKSCNGFIDVFEKWENEKNSNFQHSADD